MNNLVEMAEWIDLTQHSHDIGKAHMREWFNDDIERAYRFSLVFDEFFLDYSRNRITEDTLTLLIKLAQAADLPTKISDLFAGKPINTSEKRPALHTALRSPLNHSILVDGVNIVPAILDMQEKMREMVTAIHSGNWCGATGKPFTHVVNIGIGGSHLGPKFGVEALKDFSVSPLSFRFISSVDKTYLNEVLNEIDPETTLFVISSKTFTTIETMTNAKTIMSWMENKFGKEAFTQHFVGITANIKNAIAMGIPEEHILPLWDWVGGRYSIWSAIGFPLALRIGNEHFADMLAGAHKMDEHFQTADFKENMPMLLALIGIWNMNFLHTSVQAIVPYAHRLRLLIPYLQQADMESSGKSVTHAHKPVTYNTGSVIFGEEGCDGQHAYHQLLHQGRHLIPVDFILVGKSSKHDDHHQDILIASAISQAQALMRGKTYEEAKSELLEMKYSRQEAENLAHHRTIPGNKPSNILLMHRITPKNFGMLLALYEHKIFVQGAIWDINTFDQWGVELGKQLLPNILQHVQGLSKDLSKDPDILHLIEQFKKIQGEL